MIVRLFTEELIEHTGLSGGLHLRFLPQPTSLDAHLLKDLFMKQYRMGFIALLACPNLQNVNHTNEEQSEKVSKECITIRLSHLISVTFAIVTKNWFHTYVIKLPYGKRQGFQSASSIGIV